MAAYIEHAAFFVEDMDWYLNFFRKVYDMTPCREAEAPEGCKQFWLHGGVQLIGCKSAPKGGQCDHLCLIVDDLEGAREKALAMGCTELPKHHWVVTPDGLRIEMFSAAPGAVETLRELKKKA